jgi:integrase/recombinase XerD
VRGREPGSLLLPVHRHGRVLSRRLTEQTVHDRLRYLAERAGVSALSPHDCRRSLAGDLLDVGVDLATVQALLGRASPATTARYDRRGERAVRQAAERMQVPTWASHDVGARHAAQAPQASGDSPGPRPLIRMLSVQRARARSTS